MATFTENDVFSEDLANKIHDLNSDTFRWVLSNTAPVLSSTFLLSNVTQIATGGGYTQMTDGAGGLTTTLSFSRSGQTTTVSGTQVVLTASGAVGPFRYIILINDTPTAGGGSASPGANPVIGWLDHGSAVTMAATDTYTIPSGALFTIN
jgi:hypothetical protein